ncbi:hypothetical protein LINPERPRIM_LOCUS24439, partial [Linum perenne]
WRNRQADVAPPTAFFPSSGYLPLPLALAHDAVKRKAIGILGMQGLQQGQSWSTTNVVTVRSTIRRLREQTES